MKCFKPLLILPMFFALAGPVQAATLGSLPLGTVIQIKPTDTEMCNQIDLSTISCSNTTACVKPIRLIKMQARDTAGNPIANAGYDYWMSMDNYCYWGSANCRLNDNPSIASVYSGVDGTVDVNYSNNLSLLGNSANTDMRNNNILDPLDNFYTALPATVGGVAKSAAVLNTTWNMYGNNLDGTTGWYDPTNRPWQTGTYKSFTFSGTNVAPVMTSRVGLISYPEWQGALSSYDTEPVGAGSGHSFCQALGLDACLSGAVTLEDVVLNAVMGNMDTSTFSPLTFYPWTRSPQAAHAANVWRVDGASDLSLDTTAAVNANGVSPTFWLSADITTVDGLGTFAAPFCVNAGDCDISAECVADGGSESATTVVNLELGSYISIDCTSRVDLELPSGYGETERNMTCNVMSNNSLGYTVDVVSSDNLANGSSTIPNLGADSGTPAALTQIGSTARWAITTDTASNHFGNPVWFSSGQISDSNTASAAYGDDYTYRVGVSVGANAMLMPGTYTGTLTFTATAIDN